jgi:hypothetical protein
MSEMRKAFYHLGLLAALFIFLAAPRPARACPL